MTLVHAILLGIIQGLTEFLPVSSSGHLILAQSVLGLSALDQYIAFDVACHLGTLFAVCLSFRRDIAALCLAQSKPARMQMGLALLPLLPLTLVLGPLRRLFGMPQYLGYFFLLTASLLFLSERLSLRRAALAAPQGSVAIKRPLLEALCIGCAQAVAILPGVSRSGSTISCALFLGWDRVQAARFSFLLSIPTIIGGSLLETLQLYRHPESQASLSLAAYGAGLGASFVVGFFTLKLLMRLAAKANFTPFALYCACIGLFTLWYQKGH